MVRAGLGQAGQQRRVREEPASAPLSVLDAMDFGDVHLVADVKSKIVGLGGFEVTHTHGVNDVAKGPPGHLGLVS